MRVFARLSRTRLKRVPLLPQIFDALLYAQTALFAPRRRAAMDQVERTVLAWPGLRAHTHRFGGTEYRLRGAEIGHLHGNGVVDLPFTQATKTKLLAAGRAREHHSFPGSSWVTFVVRTEHDVPSALSLLHLSYEGHAGTPVFPSEP